MTYNYKSFVEMIDDLKRGADIEFEYNGVRYSITPNWSNNVIIGYEIGRFYSSDFTFYSDAMEMGTYILDGEMLKDVVHKLVIY